MYPRTLPLAITLALFCTAPAVLAAEGALDTLNLLEQSDALPDDFRDHFFDVPLVVRVERDGEYLGDARAVLTRDNAVSLLEFTDAHGSTQPESERERWLAVLGSPHALGPCTKSCRDGLAGLHYSLESSLLSIASEAAGQTVTVQRHLALPESGSRGLIVRHQLNAHAGEGQHVAGRYALSAQGSVGNWTLDASYQADRSGEDDGGIRHVLQSLHAQREFKDHFLRAGWFLPNFDGVTRQPRGAGRSRFTTFGVMAGSSDMLLVDSRSPSLYPVYVTANREGSVEVYRDGSLILTQVLRPGLQEVETRRLPGGIYEVELRVIEDGRETSRSTSIIHKPAQWRDPSRRWRYSAFAGVQDSLLDSFDDPGAGRPAVGGVVNYLAHPRAVLGVAAQSIGDERSLAGSVDWQVNDWANVYTNAYTSNRTGKGMDLQGLLRYRNGSVIASHTRSWQAQGDLIEPPPFPGYTTTPVREGWLRTSAVGLNHGFGRHGQFSARISHSQGISRGTGFDLSFSRRQTLFGSDANWRASVFDRPGSISSGLRRNRGVDFTLNIALGQDGRRYSGSLGSRTRAQGGRDVYASAGVQQTFADRILRSVAGQATVDSTGIGLGGNAHFESAALRGDLHLQRSSLDGGVSGGVNLESTLAVGGGSAAIAGDGQASMLDTGMIIDVRSDLADTTIRAHDSRGGSHILRPGRNLVPVSAYRPGSIQLDFDDHSVPAAAIQPSVLPYHLNKGGVSYNQVDVIRTITVLGHLQDAQGRPLAGAHVINHAGRSVAEADGFFALEMNSRMPTLVVRHPDISTCSFELDGKATRPRGEMWMAGILKCPPSAVAAQTAAGHAGEAP
jgi:hypothetical protein